MTIQSEQQKTRTQEAQMKTTEMDIIAQDVDTEAETGALTKNPESSWTLMSWIKGNTWTAGMAATLVGALVIGICTQLWGSTVSTIRQPGVDNLQNLDIQYIKEDIREVQETQEAHTDTLDTHTDMLREILEKL